MKKGKLYVVATPIGNLKDITNRAIETLKSVAFILAEDTRVSKKLLNHYSLETQLISYRDQNHLHIIEKIYEKLDMGLDLALISDAGTPLISDPGYKLVKELKENGYEVIPIPGPDSVSTALSASGLPTDSYIFLGFLAKSEKKRKEILEIYGKLGSTLVLFESPNRLLSVLESISSTLGSRRVSVCKDLTKVYEEIYTAEIQNVFEYYKGKTKIVGEYVVLVGKE
jgi:16S rRNA (cytidine1402-2'-O)-methyltransferase